MEGCDSFLVCTDDASPGGGGSSNSSNGNVHGGRQKKKRKGSAGTHNTASDHISLIQRACPCMHRGALRWVAGCELRLTCCWKLHAWMHFG